MIVLEFRNFWKATVIPIIGENRLHGTLRRALQVSGKRNLEIEIDRSSISKFRNFQEMEGMEGFLLWFLSCGVERRPRSIKCCAIRRKILKGFSCFSDSPTRTRTLWSFEEQERWRRERWFDVMKIARLPATTVKTAQSSAASWNLIPFRARLVSVLGDGRVFRIPLACLVQLVRSPRSRRRIISRPIDRTNDRSTGLIRCRDTAGDTPPSSRHFSGAGRLRNCSQLIGWPLSTGAVRRPAVRNEPTRKVVSHIEHDTPQREIHGSLAGEVTFEPLRLFRFQTGTDRHRSFAGGRKVGRITRILHER